MNAATPLPIYVINLDRSPERLAHMRENLGALGLTFHRIEAIDGRDLDDPAPLSAGERACFESHRLAWQAIAEGDAPFGVILEDDGYAHPLFAKLVADAAWIPDDAEVVKLDTRWTRVHLGRPLEGPHGCTLRPLRSPHFGCVAYIVRRDAASWMLEETARIGLTVDQFVCLPEGHPDRGQMSGRAPRVLQCVPAPNIASHRVADRPELASLVTKERTERVQSDRGPKPGRLSPARLWRNVVRPFQQLHERVLFPGWARLRGERVMRVPYADGRTARVVDGRKVRPGTDQPLRAD